jgi:hypothetical protein
MDAVTPLSLETWTEIGRSKNPAHNPTIAVIHRTFARMKSSVQLAGFSRLFKAANRDARWLFEFCGSSLVFGMLTGGCLTLMVWSHAAHSAARWVGRSYPYPPTPEMNEL